VNNVKNIRVETWCLIKDKVSMKSYWLNYNGKKVMAAAVNFKDMAEMRAEAAALVEELAKQPLNSVLCINDVNGVIMTPQWLDILQSTGKKIAPYVVRMAILGVNGDIRRRLLDMTLKVVGKASSTRTFDDQTSALD
jgi:hypothetical protein